jgi:hypothetical protein
MDLTIKDFLPLIGTALTVFAGYMFLTIQVRKNRQAKWVEDFRLALAKFCSLVPSDKEDQWEKIMQNAITIQLFLNKKDPIQLKLYSYIGQTAVFLSKFNNEAEHVGEYATRISVVEELGRQVIEAEQAKI